MTPSLAGWFLRDREHFEHGHAPRSAEGGLLLTRVIRLYESGLRGGLAPSLADTRRLRAWCSCWALESISDWRANFCRRWTKAALSLITLRPGARAWPKPIVSSASRKKSSRAHPDIESYSRRTGAALGFEVVEPNTGDFLIKLKPRRKMSTEEVIADLRTKFNAVLPDIEWEFPGILGDLIGDLTSEPQPIEVKLFSTDIEFLKKKAPEVEEQIGKVKGVVDTKDGLVYAGPSLSLRPKYARDGAVRVNRQ